MQKKSPSPTKNIPAKRYNTRGGNEEFHEQIEPVKRRKFAGGSGLEQGADILEVDSEEEVEDKRRT